MKPKLVEDWRDVVSHSFAFWLSAAGVLLLLADTVGYSWLGLDLDPYWVGYSALFLWISAMALRLTRQDGPRWLERVKVVVVVALVALAALAVSPRAFGAPATEAQTMAIAVPFVGANEGLRFVAYKPFSWDRWTICYGETHGVYPGMTATRAQCDAMLLSRLTIERNTLHRYYSADTIQNRLPPTRDASYLDVGHNCGADGIGQSTATRRLNAGDVPGGCEALTWWDRGGDRVLIGLVHRRADDYQLCMQGV